MLSRISAPCGALVGCGLVVAANFLPWLQLSSSFPGVSPYFYIPIVSVVTLNSDDLRFQVLAVVYLILTAGIVLNTVRWSTQREPCISSSNKSSLIKGSISILVLIVVTFTFVPWVSQVAYPFYDVTPNIGALSAATGAIVLIVTAIKRSKASRSRL